MASNITHSGSFADLPQCRPRGNGFSGNSTARLVVIQHVVNFVDRRLVVLVRSLLAIRRWGILDSGGAKRTDGATQIQVVGTYADNSTTVQVSTLESGQVAIAGHGNLHAQQFVCRRPEEVVFTRHRGNPEFRWTTIAVAAVPEPETYALLPWRAWGSWVPWRVAAGAATADSTAVESKETRPRPGFVSAPRAPGSGRQACDGVRRHPSGRDRPHPERPGFRARAPGRRWRTCGSSRHPALSS